MTSLLAKASLLTKEHEVLYNKNGSPTVTLFNLALLMSKDPLWRYLPKGASAEVPIIAKNLLTQSIVKRAAAPWLSGTSGTQDTGDTEWTAIDTLKLKMWFDGAHNAQVSTKLCEEIVDAVGDKNSFDPLVNYLYGNEWDKAPRVDRWLIRYMGCEDTPYHRAVGRKWLISAVARACKPGCQVDSSLIFEGPQYAGKSSAFRILGGEWYTDQVSDFETKDASADLVGVWIIELGELARINKSKIEVVKAFLTRRDDRFRAAYAHRWQRVQRRCVFAGTSNPTEYLQDPTGNRRFWPVKVGKVDLAALKADRDQLWAEAFALFMDENPWELTPEENILAAEEAEGRVISDAWEDEIGAWLTTKSLQRVTVGEVLGGALRLDSARWDQSAQSRVSRALKRLGWEKKQATTKNESGIRPYFYEPPPIREPGYDDQ